MYIQNLFGAVFGLLLTTKNRDAEQARKEDAKQEKFNLKNC